MTMPAQNKDALLEDLNRLETALDIPVIPGEMPSWAATARKTFDETARLVRKRIEEVHPDEIREIEGEDLALEPHVQELKQEDARLATECQTLTTQFADLENKAIQAGPDEKQVMALYQAAVNNGLEWVMSVRKQETAIRTWLQEAFERDRGVKD